MITHYPTCTANYPEKVAGERPKEVQVLDLGDGESVRQCVDCGAHEIVTNKDNK